MINLKSVISFLILFMITSNATLGQMQPEFVCVSGDGQEPQINDKGLLIPSIGTIKALWVVCKFSSDEFDLSPFTDRWPSSLNTPATFPSWVDSLLQPVANPPYETESISGWYYAMSVGNLNIIGRVYRYVPEHDEAYYFRNSEQSGENRRGLGFLHREILTHLDEVEEVDFSEYDKWSKDQNGIWQEQPDGVVDLIIITHRFYNAKKLQQYPFGFETENNAEFAGIASIDYWGDFFPLSFDGKTIEADHGITNEVSSPEGGVQITAHELGHLLYGYYHHQTIGLNIAGFNAFERELMGWLTYRVESANTSISDLDDFITTGEVIKIPTSDPSEYFLIENHQKLSPYETLPRWHGGPPQFAGNPGLYIFHVDTDAGTSNRLFVELASGRFDWKQTSSRYNYPFEVDKVNNRSGVSRINLPSQGVWDTQVQVVRNLTHDETVSFGLHGTPYDTFHEGHKAVFMPWSNPPTNLSNGSHASFSHSGIALLNIRQTGTTTMGFDLRMNYPSQQMTVSEDAWMFGTNSPSDEVTVNSGAILTIPSGTSLDMQAGKELVSYGDVVLGGNGTNDVAFSGDEVIRAKSGGQITVASNTVLDNVYRLIAETGGKLNINSGAEIKFTSATNVYYEGSPKGSIAVNGHFEADGATFTANSSDPDYYWAGIYIINSDPSSDYNRIQNCTIEQCKYGMVANNSVFMGFGNEISSNTFRNCLNPLRLTYGTEVQYINDNLFEDNLEDGIVVFASTAHKIQENIFQKNSQAYSGRDGIWIYGASNQPLVTNNTIGHGSQDGIRCENYAAPNLGGPNETSSIPGENTITNNGRYGVHAQASTSPFLGDYDYASSCLIYGGDNVIHSNVNKQLNAVPGGIKAEWNDWGIDPDHPEDPWNFESSTYSSLFGGSPLVRPAQSSGGGSIANMQGMLDNLQSQASSTAVLDVIEEEIALEKVLLCTGSAVNGHRWCELM